MPPARTFIAADGRHWLVREHVVVPTDGRPVHDLLLFETSSVVRWLRCFPRDWTRLTDRDLESLSQRVWDGQLEVGRRKCDVGRRRRDVAGGT